MKLDRETHLPRTAYFERGSHRWRVEYLAWDLVDVGGDFGAATSSGHQVLMPSRFVIKRRWPNLKVEIRKRDGDSETAQYLIATPHPNAFTLPTPEGTPKASLEDLGAAIDANLGR